MLLQTTIARHLFNFQLKNILNTANEFASTMQVTGKTSYSLKNSKTEKIIYTSEVVAVSSYSVVKDPYATTVAKNHIQSELSKQLAEQIALDVLTKLSKDIQ